MKQLIIKSNEWYDNLPEPKRTLFFFITIVGSLLVMECINYCISKNVIFAFLIWILLFCSWRVSYIFIDWIDWYKKTPKK